MKKQSKRGQQILSLIHFPGNRTRQRVLTFILIAFIGCAGVAIAVRAYSHHRILEAVSSERERLIALPPATPPPLQSTITGPIEVVQFAIYDVGIYPGETSVKAGKVGISIEDYSGGTSGLIVEKMTGNTPLAITTVLRDDKYMRGRQNLQLTPGTYEVYANERPNNRAKLIVE